MASGLSVRPAEQRALEIARSLVGKQILCTTVGRAQAARQLAIERPAARVVCWFLDEYQRLLAAQEELASNLTLVCEPDIPHEPFELAVLQFSMRGEAELTRDLVQSAADRLAIGGKLVAATDNPKDDWLRLQLAALFKKVTKHAFDDAVVYVVTKQTPLKKLKDFRAEFVFRDRDRLIKAVSRPGVFSHRHIDPGARHLIDAAEVCAGMKVLDIGCGAGTVALALAVREPAAEVLAIDSNARAVECTLVGARMNGLGSVRALVNARGDYPDPGTFDLALANPPYYGDSQIAVRFVAAAYRSLKAGGQLLVVTKSPNWYEEHLAAEWHDVQVLESKRYWIVRAVR